jgi:hypothetical protein
MPHNKEASMIKKNHKYNKVDPDKVKVSGTEGAIYWREPHTVDYPCPVCEAEGLRSTDCDSCAGTGIPSVGPVEGRCSSCGGSGAGEPKECEFCSGEGELDGEMVAVLLVELADKLGLDP